MSANNNLNNLHKKLNKQKINIQFERKTRKVIINLKE